MKQKLIGNRTLPVTRAHWSCTRPCTTKDLFFRPLCSRPDFRANSMLGKKILSRLFLDAVSPS